MDEATFTGQAARWRGIAIGACKACGGDTALADDVAQDVLVKLWLMRDELDSYQHVERLAHVMARHLTIDHHRRQRHDAGMSATGEVAASGPTPAEQMEALDDDHWLQRRLASLPSLQHSVLQLRQVEHYSYANIAAVLGIEESSARTLLSRARKTLLEEFKRKLRHEQ